MASNEFAHAACSGINAYMNEHDKHWADNLSAVFSFTDDGCYDKMAKWPALMNNQIQMLCENALGTVFHVSAVYKYDSNIITLTQNVHAELTN